MPNKNDSDLQSVDRYLDEVTAFIHKIVLDEAAAVVIAAQVFEAHGKATAIGPWSSEEHRFRWLLLRSRNLSLDYLKRKGNERVKTEAIGAAIRQYPD